MYGTPFANFLVESAPKNNGSALEYVNARERGMKFGFLEGRGRWKSSLLIMCSCTESQLRGRYDFQLI